MTSQPQQFASCGGSAWPVCLEPLGTPDSNAASKTWVVDNCQEELWKRIPDFPNYELSTHGRVRKTKSQKIIKCGPNKHGYPVLKARRKDRSKSMFLARWVALVFIGEPPSPNHQAAHNDGNKLNNNLKNLRWATPQENCDDRKRHGTHPAGEKNSRAKLTENQAREILFSKERNRDLCKKYHVSTATISQIRNGKRWPHLMQQASR